jgi:hypothetical protein
MAKVKSVNLSFPASDSPDVEGYKLYLEESPNEVTYESQSFDLGNNTSVDLATLDGMTTRDGNYNIGITAVDDAGNESSMSLISDVPLDFEAPNPPGAIVITRV